MQCRLFSSILALLSLSLLSIALNSHAAEHQKLEIVVGDWPPFLDQKLQHNGIIAKLISDILSDEGYEVQFFFRPWGRAYLEASTGQRDATAIWMHKPEREKDFYFSQPVMKESFVFFHLRKRPFNWNSLQDLKGMTLGGGINYSYGPEFNAALEDDLFKQERTDSKKQNFKLLLLGRIDLYPEEVTVGYQSLYRDLSPLESQKITHHPTPFLSNDSFLLFPRKKTTSPALMAAFNRRLKEYRDSGRYKRYFENARRAE